MTAAHGVYLHADNPMFSMRPGSKFTGVLFNKDYINNIKNIKKEFMEKFKIGKASTLVGLKKSLVEWEGMGISENTIRNLKNKIENIERTHRWDISLDSIDPLRSLAIHECYHALYFNRDLSSKWKQLLIDNDVDIGSKCEISEYAATNDSELFAEVGCAIENDFKIPDNIYSAFKETIGEI